MRKYNYYFIAAALALLPFCRCSSLATETMPTIDELILIAKSNCENIHAIDISFTTEQELVGSRQDYCETGLIPFMDQRAIADLGSDRFYLLS